MIAIFPVKLLDGGKLPTQKKGDAGFDLYASESVILPPGKVTRVRSGVVLAGPLATSEHMPKGCTYFLKIEGRSGKALEGIFPVGGIVDASYRGELIGLMFNANNFSVEVKAGDKFAQLVAYPIIANTENISVTFSATQEVEPTDRGDKGFGSSGG